MVVFGGRGGRGNEGRAQVDGLNTGASLNGGGVSGYRQDVENAQEVAITTAGGLGETEVGGPTINIVPRTGGNTFRSHVFFTGLRGGMQASNFSEELQTGRAAHAGEDELHLRHQLLARWSDQAGQDLVLFPRLLPRQREHDPRHVLQQERMGPDEVGLFARREPARPFRRPRPVAAGTPPHLPAVVARQAESCSGTNRSATTASAPGQRDERTRNRRPQSRLAARAAGEVDIHGHEQAAARRGSRHVPVQLEHARTLRGGFPAACRRNAES